MKCPFCGTPLVAEATRESRSIAARDAACCGSTAMSWLRTSRHGAELNPKGWPWSPRAATCSFDAHGAIADAPICAKPPVCRRGDVRGAEASHSDRARCQLPRVRGATQSGTRRSMPPRSSPGVLTCWRVLGRSSRPCSSSSRGSPTCRPESTGFRHAAAAPFRAAMPSSGDACSRDLGGRPEIRVGRRRKRPPCNRPRGRPTMGRFRGGPGWIGSRPGTTDSWPSGGPSSTATARMSPASRKDIEESGQPALDLGCGTGRLLLPFLRAGLDVDGCGRLGRHESSCAGKRPTARGSRPVSTPRRSRARAAPPLPHDRGLRLVRTGRRPPPGSRGAAAHPSSPGARRAACLRLLSPQLRAGELERLAPPAPDRSFPRRGPRTASAGARRMARSSSCAHGSRPSTRSSRPWVREMRIERWREGELVARERTPSGSTSTSRASWC